MAVAVCVLAALFLFNVPLSIQSTPVETPQAAIEEMLRLHNYYRGQVMPTAANMHPLVSLSLTTTSPYCLEMANIMKPQIAPPYCYR